MQIEPFLPNEERVKQRSTIKPFGKMADEDPLRYTQDLQPPKFIRADIVDTLENEEESGIYVFKPTFSFTENKSIASDGSYIPPYMRSKPCSIKVTNLPEDMNRNKLEELVFNLTKNRPSSTHVVLDRDTKASRGYGYVAFITEEYARHAVKAVDGYIIDGLIIGAEIVKNN